VDSGETIVEKREDVKNSVLPRWRSAAINRAIFNYCKKGHIYIIIMQLSSINLKLCIYAKNMFLKFRGGSSVLDDRFTRSTQPLGGSGGMLPWEIFKIWASETAFPAFWRHFLN
jgi:hypothetical protein